MVHDISRSTRIWFTWKSKINSFCFLGVGLMIATWQLNENRSVRGRLDESVKFFKEGENFNRMSQRLIRKFLLKAGINFSFFIFYSLTDFENIHEIHNKDLTSENIIDVRILIEERLKVKFK